MEFNYGNVTFGGLHNGINTIGVLVRKGETQKQPHVPFSCLVLGIFYTADSHKEVVQRDEKDKRSRYQSVEKQTVIGYLNGNNDNNE